MTRRTAKVGGAILASALGATLLVQTFASAAPSEVETPGVLDATGLVEGGSSDVGPESVPSDDGESEQTATGPIAPDGPPEDLTGTAGQEVVGHEERAAADRDVTGKSDPATTDPTSAVSSSGAAEIPVHVVFYERTGVTITVTGYADVVELGAICELVVVGEGGTFRSTGAAATDASSTSCGELVLTDSSLATGEWSATLLYSSPISSGASPTVVSW